MAVVVVGEAPPPCIRSAAVVAAGEVVRRAMEYVRAYYMAGDGHGGGEAMGPGVVLSIGAKGVTRT